VLRCGWFYGPGSAHIRLMGERLVKSQLPLIGSGEVRWAYLHVEDAASAFVAAAEKGKSGLWHIVDNEGGTIKEFLSFLARRLGARPPYHIPAWLARLVVGSARVSAFTSSVHTSNARFQREFGWTPRYPSYREGLDQIINAWKMEGFLLKTQADPTMSSTPPTPVPPEAE